MLKRVYLLSRSYILDLLFPRYCIGCGEEGAWICMKCLKTIDIIKQPFCPECRRPTSVGEFCDGCRQRFALDGIFICANFGEGVLKEAIHQFKYNHIFDIGEILGRIMAGKISDVRRRGILDVGHQEFDMVVPVPLYKKRLRERGFNQSEILGRKLSLIRTNDREWGDMVFKNNILVRKRYTTPQAELDREQRLSNLKDVFEFVGDRHACPSPGDDINIRNSHGCSLRGKNVLLVDDITTTGATLEECAKVLKLNGAQKVWGIVLAKGK